MVFLRYESVGGQDRLYVYDSNYPDEETYLYKDAKGKVLQAPVQTIAGSIDSIELSNVKTVFRIADSKDFSRAIYIPKGAATVQGYSGWIMKGGVESREYEVYDIPSSVKAVTIIPNEDNADFIYMDTEYSFGEVNGKTRGRLEFTPANAKYGGAGATFTIYEKDSAVPTVTLSKERFSYDGKVHKPKVTVKAGGEVLKESRDYTVKYPSGMKKVGDYVVKVTMRGEYSGSVSKTFTITKAANPMVAKGKTAKVKASALKRGSKVVSAKKAFSVKKAKGKVTYKKVSGNAKVAVASNGKVIVKKGLKKGTYKVKVKVTAKGNSKWKAKIKKVTLKVRVV